MHKLRIGLLIETLHRHGGLERRTSALANGLLAAGHEVHIYANKWDSEAAEGAHFHRVPMLKLDRAMKLLGFAWFSSRLAAGNDLIHTQARVFRYDLATLGGGCHKAYLDAMGIDPQKTPDRRIHRVILHIERSMFDPKNFVRGNRIIVNSNKCKAEIIDHYSVPEASIDVVHNGVDREAFSPEMCAGRRTTARTELGLDANEIAILLVGTGFERKGLKTLIRAAGILNAEKPACRIRVLVVGSGKTDGYKAGATELGIAERLVWVGRADDIAKHYAAADIFVLPTRYDPFANSTMEALASGIPVITTTANGVSEIIRDGTDGLIIEPNDAEALADRLNTLASDAKLRQHIGSSGRKAVEPYTWQRTTEQTIAVYEKIIISRNKL